MSPLVGSYHIANRDDDQVKEAAQFAVQLLASNNRYNGFNFDDSTTVHVSIIKALQQVVAGMNYKLTLEIKDGDGNGECLGAFDVTIYDRFGDLSVTNWGEEYDCERVQKIKEEDEG
eukprot:CAMPEP_0194135594 /NCGR_PEP_ID=MMETSP0152-20130528/5701_1 /TAXON_ID=1049557 /ORGANISM="Thalassiothrix antarctica, Strain L6-D1" /LENGTH=116 /DNA_ID=CAMNT_0038831913 /DNA_START=214 /DNA_END=564 /DNA_ORIENTATION=-